jgi:hypothetical protein
MKVQKNGDLTYKERNRSYLHELDIAENKSALNKLRPIFRVPVSGTMKEQSDSALAAHIATAYENSLLRRAQMLQ